MSPMGDRRFSAVAWKAAMEQTYNVLLGPKRHPYHAFRWYGETIVDPGSESWPRTRARCQRCGEERVISLFVDNDRIVGPCLHPRGEGPA